MIATDTLFRRFFDPTFIASKHTGHGPFKMWFKLGTAVDTPLPMKTTLNCAADRGVADIIFLQFVLRQVW
jgi:hypothetical protein